MVDENTNGQNENQTKLVPGSPEYDEAMAGVFAGANVNVLPDEFKKDPSLFVKALKDTKAELTRLQMEAAKGKAPQESPKEPPKTDTGTPPAAVQIPEGETVDEGKVDWNQVKSEFYKAGTISDETKTKLTKIGIPAEIIDGYIQGLTLQVKQQTDKAVELCGSQENLDKMVQWYAKNKTPEQKEEINKNLQGSNGFTYLAGMWAEYAAANSLGSKEPRQIGGVQTNVSSTAKPFRDQAELVAAMADPRYKTNPDYRKEVEDRCRASAGKR